MKHDRLSILRAQEAARLNDEKANAFYTEATGRSTRFRDDPTYRDKVLAFEARQTLPTPPKTAAPAASAEKRSFLVGAKYSDVKYELNRLARLDGQAARDLLTRFGVRKAVDLVFAQYAEFITACAQEIDRIQKEMVAPKVEEPKYWVCVKAYGKHGWQVGEVRHTEPSDADCWFPCDKDGWVTHDPQPDSTCPVPEGVKPEAKCRCGTPEPHPSPNSWQLGVPGDRRPSMFDIVAWRPVKS